MAQDDPLFEYLLRLGDNCLVLGHRLSEWCGRGPALEEDIALANTALDLIGQARFWLTLAGEVEGQGRDADKLAYLRDVARLPQPAAGRAEERRLRRHHDAPVLLRRLALAAARPSCSIHQDQRIAEIAAKAIKEVAYHLERSGDWIIRLGDGTEESHRRAQAAVDRLWAYTGELFEADEVDDRAVGVDLAALRQPWLDLVGRTLAEATLDLPDPDAWMQKGGKRGLHTEQLGYLLAEMQSSTAPIRERPGDRHGDPPLGRAGLGLARRGARPRDPGGLGGRSRHRPRRALGGRRRPRRHRHADLFRLPRHRLHLARDRADACARRAWRTSGWSGGSPRPGPPTGSPTPAASKLRAYGIAPPVGKAAAAWSGMLARQPLAIACPRCGSSDTARISEFGSTPVQGAVPLPGLPGALRLLQVPLMATFHPLTVTGIRRETRDSIVLTLAPAGG